jgi:hypothetical protein
MVANRVARGLGFLWLATGAFACASPGGSEGPLEAAPGPAVDVAAVTENGLIGNGLIGNGLIGNGLIGNGLIGNGLIGNGLTLNGLIGNGLIGNGANAGLLSDPMTLKVLKYVVSCALNSQQSLSFTTGGTTHTFPGELGLAPQWGTANGSCDGSCQRWVSACLLARVDAAGIDREISVRGPNMALLPTWSELFQYTQREATYFGNLFIPGQPRFLCLAPGQKQDQRVCGDSLDDCPMAVVASCNKDCVGPGLLGEYDLCSDAGRVGTGHTYLESITVFLPKSTM